MSIHDDRLHAMLADPNRPVVFLAARQVLEDLRIAGRLFADTVEGASSASVTLLDALQEPEGSNRAAHVEQANDRLQVALERMRAMENVVRKLQGDMRLAMHAANPPPFKEDAALKAVREHPDRKVFALAG